jgi:hypothetical protein
MRRILIAGSVLAAVAGTVRADDTAPSRSISVGFVAQATRLAEQPNRNLGASVELALGRGRWQYFGEVGVLAVSIGEEVIRDHEGYMLRGGAGVRWLARTFRAGRGGLDLGLEAVAAVEDIRWTRGGHLLRPELGVGFCWDVRVPWFVSRTSIRIVHAPRADAMDVPACRGSCASTPSPSAAGFMVITGLAW